MLSSDESKEEKTPVIVNFSTETQRFSSEMMSLLERQHKLRTSDKICENCCIFPLSSIAFMVCSPQQFVPKWPLAEGRSVNILGAEMRRLEKFVSIHKNSYLILVCAMHGQVEREIFAQIQKRFLSSKLQMQPAHNAQEAVQCMNTIAKSTTKTGQQQAQSLLPTGRKIMDSDALLTHFLQAIGLTKIQAEKLLRSFGTLRLVAAASREDLKKCGMDQPTCDKITRFFSAD